MKSLRSAPTAILFLGVLVAAYVHFFSMLYASSHCQHASQDHSTCIATLQGFAPSESTFFTPLLLSVFVCGVVLYAWHSCHQSYVYLSETNRLFVDLFRRGILHPKAP